uniref:Uncharacterized protein n=1 Tax=uncultured Chloroflexota bacterium TaxID=166587 RepID=H5SAK2_9CHLR|nr:hypothetical protein HGMM_F05B10C10 [uncultured Chloroflexota bacterium]
MTFFGKVKNIKKGKGTGCLLAEAITCVSAWVPTWALSPADRETTEAASRAEAESSTQAARARFLHRICHQTSGIRVSQPDGHRLRSFLLRWVYPSPRA